MIKWLLTVFESFRTSILNRYRRHKKLMFLGSLYGILTNKNEASKVEIRGLLKSLGLNVSENAIRLPLAIQNKIWKRTNIHQFITCNDVPCVVAILKNTPADLKYDTNEVMAHDISMMIKYVREH